MIPGDNPIQSPDADVLGRTAVAERFACYVLELDTSEGAAVGVFGPWGSGKTSFINLARKEFEQAEIPVLDFNPWMFSGAEQLVGRFFAELSAKMGKTDGLEKIGQSLAKYGDTLNMVTSIASKLLGMPQVGQILSVVLKTATDIAEQPTSADDLRKKVDADLKERNGKPIIVVLDDVDRLSAPEIRDVFKLVRLTASFPSLIYIVVCDRFRVEQALSEQGLSGRDYLEKILQLPFDLPQIPPRILQEQVSAATETALADIESPGPSDNKAWTYIYAGIVRPLVRNMRDVRRYAAAVRGTVIGLGGQVALADVLGLEAVRLFLPDVFKRLPGAIDALTLASVAQENERNHDELLRKYAAGSTGREDPTENDARLVARIDKLIKENGKEVEAAHAMVNCLFPPGRKYLDNYNEDLHLPMGEQHSERRVFHEHILRLYLERVVNDDMLAFNDAERAFERMVDCVKLETLIRSLDPARWLDVILHLENFGNQFRPEHVEPGIVGLLNLLPETPKRSRIYPFDDYRTVVMSITHRLLSVLKDAPDIKAAVRRILPRVTSLSSRVELVLRVGHREKFGGKLVSEEAAVELEKMLRDEIRAASADDLAGERDLGRILVLAKRGADPSGDPLDIPDSPKLTFAILRALAIKVTDASDYRTRPDRAFLIDLYGDEATLKARIESLNAQFEALKPWIESLPMPLDDAERLLELANERR